VLSRLFRRLFLEELVKAFDAGKLEFFSTLEACRDRGAFLRYPAPLREVEWVVYAKRPFAGPEQVLDYVGRYTHRVAISNDRLLDIADGNVTFRYKDYRHDSQQKTMTLKAEAFIRRFLLHVLPDGFQRIRYYGFLGNRHREEKLARCRQLLGMPASAPPATEAFHALGAVLPHTGPSGDLPVYRQQCPPPWRPIRGATAAVRHFQTCIRSPILPFTTVRDDSANRKIGPSTANVIQ
jgi:hypothetical protein